MAWALFDGLANVSGFQQTPDFRMNARPSLVVVSVFGNGRRYGL
jgi:hypothetical protein